MRLELLAAPGVRAYVRRRSLLLGLLSVACAPHREPDSPPESPAVPDGWPTPREDTPASSVDTEELLVLAHWSAPVSGWTQELAVYEDGLLELMWFDDTPGPGDPFARSLRLMSLRVPEGELDPLRAVLSSAGFAEAEPHYSEDGVMDGGALTIADQASHRRRIIIVNDPDDAPTEVRTAESQLDALVERVKHEGRSAFEPGPDRVVALWSFARGETSQRLTVHDSGLVELRTVYTSNSKAHAARDYPTPYASTRRASAQEIAALRDTLAATPHEEIRRSQAEGGTVWHGDGVEQRIPAKPSDALDKVLSLLEAMELTL